MPTCEETTKVVKMEELAFERERLNDNMVYTTKAFQSNKTQIDELTSSNTSMKGTLTVIEAEFSKVTRVKNELTVEIGNLQKQYADL
jgi:chromosome segregation ATPase